MKSNKNKFLIIFIINVILLILVLLLIIPTTNFLSKINLKDNNFVKDQVIINPEVKPPKVLDRTLQIKFVAKVDKLLEWKFKPLQDTIVVKIGENRII